MRKRIGSKKIGRSGNGNVFQNFKKIVVNFFEKKKEEKKITQQTQKSCLV